MKRVKPLCYPVLRFCKLLRVHLFRHIPQSVSISEIGETDVDEDVVLLGCVPLLIELDERT